MIRGWRSGVAFIPLAAALGFYSTLVSQATEFWHRVLIAMAFWVFLSVFIWLRDLDIRAKELKRAE